MAKLNEKDEEKKVVNNTPLGVDEETWSNTQNSFEKSDELANREKNTQNTYSNLESLTSKENIISDSTKKNLNSQFVVPNEVTKADAWLSNQLATIQSGKTSYSDQVKDMMDKILNREKFSYDVDKDPLFQQALAGAMNSGKQAMQDTIGQASALTGGYGSTYATSAGNQAYNSFIEDAYDNLPQYYQMAMEAYQMEGDEMYRQFGMVSELDDKEYNRNVTAYDATYQHRNRVYDEAYNMYRDEKSDAFAMANLELNEHGQRVNDAYNLYNAASNQEDKLYEREYNSWADSINTAFKTAEMQNSDAWANKNFDEGVRQYEKNYAENVRQFDKTYTQNEDHFTRNLNFQASENAKDRAIKAANNSGNNSVAKSIPDSIEKETKNAKNNEARMNYVSEMVEKGYISREQGAYLLDTYNQADFKDRVWEVKSKGGLNWGGGIDKNAKVTDQYDNEYKMSDLYAEASKTMGEDEAEKWIIQLQKDLGISWRN